MIRLIRSRAPLHAVGRTLRRAGFGAVIAAVLITLVSGMALAQDTSHKLHVGDTVTGAFDLKTFAQVYTFDAVKGDSVTITALSKTKGLLLALILSDAAGQSLNQTASVSGSETIIRDFKPAADGSFYVTVLRSTGIQGNTPGSFTLTLAGAVTPTPVPAATAAGSTSPLTSAASVTLTDGLSIALGWASTDDMSLEVRDPVGGAANIKTPKVASGGVLSGHVNADCKSTTANHPTETVAWPKGGVPIGSYEILAYFNQSCAQGVVPLPFTITVTVDGQAQPPIQGSFTAKGTYVVSFLLDAQKGVTIQPGGVNGSIDLTPFAAKLASPTALGTRTQAIGTLDHSNAADAYSFDGHKGETISVGLGATSGSLDAFLLLLDAGGNVIAQNDDANATTRDSLLSNQVLPADGTYTIVATRFALAIGGTEGGYSLKLTRGKTVAVVPTVAGSTTGTIATATPGTITNAAATSTLGAGLPMGSIEASLRWDSRADLRLWIRDPQGRAVYTDVPKVDSGGTLFLSTNQNCKTVTGTNPQDYTYWNSAQPPKGTYEVKVWENANCGDTVQTTFTLNLTVRNNAGAVTHLIDNYSNNPGPDKQVYLVTFTVDGNGNATAGNGDFVTNQFTTNITAQAPDAPNVVYNQTISGQITATAPYVLYQFAARTGNKIRITMRARSGNIDPELFLMGSGGAAQINFNDDAADPALGPLDARIIQTISADGTYVIVATRYGVELGGTTGKFDLTLTGPTR